MKPKLLLCLALVLSGGFFGCSTAHRITASEQTNTSPLYLHFGSDDGGFATRFLSARIHLDEQIIVGGDDFVSLEGNIEQRGANLVADVMGSTGQQSQFYRGNVKLEKPFFAQGGAASGGAGPPFWFLISTNSDCETILKRVNAVRGFTNSPFSHRNQTLPPPVMSKTSKTPKDIDPATGLPWNYGNGNRSVDPLTGLPVTTANEILAKQMFDILKECESIKPGMTRADLLKIFTTEGGLSTQTRRTFVHSRCPYIKVDVEFAPEKAKQEQPTDTITKISKPYLAWSIID